MPFADKEGVVRTPWDRLIWLPGPVQVDLVGESMAVEAFVTEDGLRFVDDWGGERHVEHRRFPFTMCDSDAVCSGPSLRRAEDQVGLLADIRRDVRGYPMGALPGDVLGVRYHYNPEDLASLADEPTWEGSQWVEPEWTELIDTRTGERVLDTRQLGEVPGYSSFLLRTDQGVSLARAEFGDELHVPVELFDSVYAMIPVDGGEVWRSMRLRLNWAPAFNDRLDYTDTHVRAHLREGVVVQAPRSRQSAEPIVLVHPDQELPIVGPGGPHFDAQLPRPVPSVKHFPLARPMGTGIPGAGTADPRMRIDSFAGETVETECTAQSTTWLHEWANLVGRTHDNFGGASSPAMSEEIDEPC